MSRHQAHARLETIILSVAAWAWMCAAPLAMSAEPDLFEMPLESLMEVRVSVASPYEETVFNAAASVAVLQPEDWERRAAQTLGEALEQVPAVSTYTSLGGARMFAVRGYATELSARGIATLLDGVPLNNYSYATSAYDLPFIPLDLLGRIEMIRGPGSTLYGSDAFHGVLDIHTRSLSDASRHLAARAGSHEDGSLSLIGNTATKTIRIDGGLALTHQGDRDLTYTYTDAFTGQAGTGVRDNHEHDASGFLHVESGESPSDFGLWRLSLYGNRYDSRGFPAIGTQFYQPLQNSFQLASLSLSGAHDVMGQESDFWQAQLLHQRELTHSLELEIKAFQWESDQTWIANLQDYPDSLTTLGNVVLPCRTSPGQTGVSPLYCPHTLSQGTADRRRGLEALLRPQNALFGNTRWAVGFGRNWLTITDAFVRRQPDNAPLYVETQSPYKGASRHIDHALLHVRSDFHDGKFAAVYGLRWDGYSDVGSATSPRLGLIWAHSKNWTGKLLYSHAFRAPSAAEQYGGGTGSNQLPNPDIKAETIDTLEMIWQYKSQQQATELVLFSSHWKDGIVLGPVGLGENQYQNTGRNNAQGVELSHHHQWGAWRLEGNAAYVTSRNKTSESEYNAFPTWTLNLGLGYRFLTDWEAWLNERALLDRTRTDSLGMTRAKAAPDHFRTDFHVNWKPRNYQLNFDIRNLFDRKNIAPAMYNAEGGLPDERLSVHVGVTKTW